MLVHNHYFDSEINQPFFRSLISDPHVGSRHTDYNWLVGDLDRAAKVKARILLNGDIFDCIGHKDKRFNLSVLLPELSGRADLSKAMIEKAKEIFWPYRHLIDVIGIGNHEKRWIDYNYGDPVRRLIEELRSEGDCGAVHGSYWGYINSVFNITGSKKKADRAKHRLLYYHGSGGDSPVTKGTIDFNRKGRNWDYDCLTFGHKHNIVCTIEQLGGVTQDLRYSERRQLNLQTGSYYRNYEQLTDETALDLSYAATSAHPPKPMGGLILCMRPRRDANGELYVHQDFMTDVIAPTWG